jgi:hypothetical protein
MSLVAGMAAGADSIDDLDLLRRAGAARVFTGVRAPSTLGTFLRGFTFGHVRQLDAVAARTLAALAAQVPLLPGIQTDCLIDIDDTVKDVYGPAKQGAEFGYTKVRGLNAQLATISTADAAPVIAVTRLRRGAAPSAHGAVRMLRDAIATARRCGADGQVLVRADSAYCSSAILQAVSKAGARFSIGMPLNSRVRAAIGQIPEYSWVRIEYPWAIPDPDTGERDLGDLRHAQQESFWSTLKTEFYNRHTFTTRADAIEAVSRWITTVYNTRRRHSALGYISPQRFEQQYITAAEAA